MTSSAAAMRGLADRNTIVQERPVHRALESLLHEVRPVFGPRFVYWHRLPSNHRRHPERSRTMTNVGCVSMHDLTGELEI